MHLLLRIVKFSWNRVSEFLLMAQQSWEVFCAHWNLGYREPYATRIEDVIPKLTDNVTVSWSCIFAKYLHKKATSLYIDMWIWGTRDWSNRQHAILISTKK